MHFFKKQSLILFILVFSIMSYSPSHAAPKLNGYCALQNETSVSGLSSGAFMTTQFHVAYSDMLMGAGIVAGGPYFCSGSYDFNSFIVNATTVCMNPIGPGPNPETLLKKAKNFDKKGWIDSLENLKNDKVYIFSGTNDKVVKQKVVDQTAAFYKLAGVPESYIKFVTNVPAGHAFITNNPKDNQCSVNEAPYINNCSIYQANDILSHIYGKLNPPAKKLSSKLIQFDQTEFANTKQASMNDFGFIYVPKNCEKGKCRIHVAIHGCKQGEAVIGDLYASSTGYNQVADTNNIIVIYPQVSPSNVNPYNPEGCWDFWGYTSANNIDPDFYKKSAIQMTAIKDMIKRVQEPLNK